MESQEAFTLFINDYEGPWQLKMQRNTETIVRRISLIT
jgi:hypothetical protein